MIVSSPATAAEPRAGGQLPCNTGALIAEARRRRRQRWRAAAAVLSAGLVSAALAGTVVVLSGRSGGAASRAVEPKLPGPTRRMPSQVVVVTSWLKVEVLSSRTGRAIRTLATDVGPYQGPAALAVSPAGIVYFEKARNRQVFVASTPLTGGPITTIAVGHMPAISPDGKLLAYVTYKGLIHGVQAIVVRDLATGAERTCAFASSIPYIDSLSWSPDSEFLAFTANYWANARQHPIEIAGVLDTPAGGTLGSARRIPLGNGLQWAGFLTPDIGLAVTAQPSGSRSRQSLVEVAVRTGRVLRWLASLPADGLGTFNAYDGTEGTITADPTGHFILIAANGPPPGDGEIFRVTVGTHRLVRLTSGAMRAVWA